MRDFREQDLTGALFERVSLRGARFTEVYLNEARLREVDLTGTDIHAALPKDAHRARLAAGGGLPGKGMSPHRPQ